MGLTKKRLCHPGLDPGSPPHRRRLSQVDCFAIADQVRNDRLLGQPQVFSRSTDFSLHLHSLINPRHYLVTYMLVDKNGELVTKQALSPRKKEFLLQGIDRLLKQ